MRIVFDILFVVMWLKWGAVVGHHTTWWAGCAVFVLGLISVFHDRTLYILHIRVHRAEKNIAELASLTERMSVIVGACGKCIKKQVEVYVEEEQPHNP